MSDLMFYGVLQMPYEMAMDSELSRRQFYSRVQEAVQRLKEADRRAAPASEPAGYLCPNDPDAASAFKWPKAGANLGCGSCKAQCVPVYFGVSASEPAVDRDAPTRIVLEHYNCTLAEWREFMKWRRNRPPTPAAPEVPAPAASIEQTAEEARAALMAMPLAEVAAMVQGAQAQPEPEMNPACGCMNCNPKMISRMMFLCTTCGNKRCPHATDHRRACTNSNEPGQVGSAYGVLDRAATSKSIEGGE